MAFKLGYSTYALQMVDPFEAVDLISDTGYEAIEICMGEAWPTSPLKFSASQQRELASKIKDSGFDSPIFFGGIDVCAPHAERMQMFDLTKQKFQMANEIHFDDSPVLITTTAGHSAPPWDSGKEQIRDAFVSLADMAAENNAIIAIEPHAGTDFETPEKAAWMMAQTRHPNLKLDLDISHFFVEGSEVRHSVNLTAPDAVMVHIKDGEKVDGKVRYCLPGDGNIDIVEFLSSLRDNAVETLPVFAEVSVQQSLAEGYSPEETAKFCFTALDSARKSLG